MCTKAIRKAKNDYMLKKLTNLNNDSKSKWIYLKNIMRSNTDKNEKMPDLIYENRLVCDNGIKADIFNMEYTTNLKNKLDVFYKNYEERVEVTLKEVKPIKLDMGNNDDKNLNFFIQTDNNEIFKQIKQIKNGISHYEQVLGNSFVKLLNSQISQIMAFFINLMYKSARIPIELKKAVILPKFKKGAKNNVQNYRPIANITILAKILEKNMLARIKCWAKQNDLIDKNQYAYQINKSVSDAILNKTDYIYNALNNNKNIFAVYLDLTRAFETINHKILLDKLSEKGCKNKGLELLENYLYDRTQITMVNGSESKLLNVKLGVPQGTILGPWLFILFFDDIFKVCNLPKTICFADDTLLLYEMDKNIKESHLPADIKLSINKFSDWFTRNLLLINYEKSNFMIYSTYNANGSNKFDLDLMNNRIQSLETVKYLGCHFDRTLNWSTQIKDMMNKLKFYGKYAIYLQKILDLQTKLMWYYAYVHSLLINCAINLSDATNNLKNKLQNCQLRII